MLVETYGNTLYDPSDLGSAQRFWCGPATSHSIMVGGSILSQADCAHLQQDFGIEAILSVESERPDWGRADPRLPQIHIPMPDDGQPKPIEWWAAGIAFGIPVRKLYVHCQMGHSRSPAMAYALLRVVHKQTTSQALANIRLGHPSFGNHPAHQAYIRSAETAISALRGAFIGVP